MRLLIDTNILVSAALFPNSVPAKAFTKAVIPPHEAVVCDYSLDEMRRVFNRKFLHRLGDFESFVSRLILAIEVIGTPDQKNSVEGESAIRDVNDRPIFRAAVSAKVDIIITGDKDFLESGIAKPKSITAADFLKG
ncbi:MAG: putative toxin-antitoxin system toxin component, PIN family [Deltaproteobacteria bacterium]|jgi:putative PIN family toxin of toxin-antitoxin system|nr:putative toxin-antitoxin system toxin component, PIN family [Deltaproteobacteria bacterium]